MNAAKGNMMAKPTKHTKTNDSNASANDSCCGPMFREDGCFGGGSHNSHSAADYEPRYPRHDEIASIAADGTAVIDGLDEGIAGGVRRQVLNQLGQRNGTASFRSLLGREKR